MDYDGRIRSTLKGKRGSPCKNDIRRLPVLPLSKIGSFCNVFATNSIGIKSYLMYYMTKKTNVINTRIYCQDDGFMFCIDKDKGKDKVLDSKRAIIYVENETT